MSNYIYVNSILDNPSLCDGPGYRTVLFLQGCNLNCKGCHNKNAQDIYKGKKMEVKSLSDLIRKKCTNKKLTISGGEPLMQEESLLVLLKELKDFDLCLYTGHEKEEVSKEIISYLTYIKTGPFKEELKTSTIPYMGSSNQKFTKLK